jgi:NAD(P)-dependent dehydrogenase (short-subunit alcohol dehydrogenase family)
MDISGQVAIVTGGGSGLGAATARFLASKGAKIGILDFDGTAGAAVASEVGGLSVQVDVGDAAQVEAAIDTIVSQLGGPRVVVNCAGVANAARMVGREGKLAVELFERVIRVNLIGTFNVMSYATRAMMDLPLLENGERGVIINTSSAAYQDGQMGQAAYSASKGGVASMCLPLARELAQSAVRVMAIAPGLFGTPMMMSLPTEVTDAIIKNVPHPARLGQPNEFGLLVSQIIENPYLNGEVIRLDGATRLPPR